MTRIAVLAALLVVATACGVSTEDTPQVIDDPSSQSLEPTPSVDTESPTTTPTPTSTSPAGVP